MMTYSYPIILASQSPRRKQLLQWAEIPFTIRVANTDETYPESLTPAAIAIHIAREKAATVKQQLSPAEVASIIIAADTIVVLEDDIIGKPADRQMAIATLQKLSGQRHQVVTGVVINAPGGIEEFSNTTTVHFHELTDTQLAFYVDKYKPYDKAGAYAIQEWIGVVGIKSVEGDFYNVMGLPVSQVVQALEKYSENQGKIPR